MLDEVQTGMYRTGPFLAAHGFRPGARYGGAGQGAQRRPDSGGRAADVRGGFRFRLQLAQRAIVHTSTFSENGLAMRAGLATLDVLEEEVSGERAARLGERLRAPAAEALGALRDGEGWCAARACSPASSSPRRASSACACRSKPSAAFIRRMFGQVLVMRLFRDHGILTQICGNNFMVLKAAPPLVIPEDQLDEFVRAVRAGCGTGAHLRRLLERSAGPGAPRCEYLIPCAYRYLILIPALLRRRRCSASRSRPRSTAVTGQMYNLQFERGAP